VSSHYRKFAYVWRRLWIDDGLFRLAVTGGPAALIGGLCLIGLGRGAPATEPPGLPAAASAPAGPDAQAPWAKPGQPERWQTGESALNRPMPERPVPPQRTDGALYAYVYDWRVLYAPFTIGPNFEVDLGTPVFGATLIATAAMDMGRIIAAGSGADRAAAMGRAFFVARMSGVYEVSARFVRQSDSPATCVANLSFAGKLIFSKSAALSDPTNAQFEVARFDLEPGLFQTDYVFGCWQDERPSRSGRLELLIRHPGEDALRSPRPDDFASPQLEIP
jgi:hypothetical protein